MRNGVAKGGVRTKAVVLAVQSVDRLSHDVSKRHHCVEICDAGLDVSSRTAIAEWKLPNWL